MSGSDKDQKDPKPAVGYGAPPLASRFKAGQSGNPKGRPKGSRNFATEIEAELKSRVTVSENGKTRKVAKRTLIAKQLVNKGAQGDPKAIGLLLQQERLNDVAPTQPLPDAPETLPQQDLLVVEHFLQRMRALQGPETEAVVHDAPTEVPNAATGEPA